MIELFGVQKTYGARTALYETDFRFAEGERYALIGANGSGKSTLLSLLAGTIRPTRGSVSCGGIPPDQIGYLPQSPYAFDLSVLQNVMLPLASRDKDAKRRAMEILERLDLEKLANARGNRLSGGETQRMALARLLVKPWRALLLDEPTAAADLDATDQAEDALLDYAKANGSLVIFASHAPRQALRLGTQALYLHGGRVAEYGCAADVLLHPQTEAAQSFLRHWLLT